MIERRLRLQIAQPTPAIIAAEPLRLIEMSRLTELARLHVAGTPHRRRQRCRRHDRRCAPHHADAPTNAARVGLQRHGRRATRLGRFTRRAVSLSPRRHACPFRAPLPRCVKLSSRILHDMTFHVPQSKTCSVCGKPRDLGYHSYCRDCRNAYMRDHRPKHSELTEEQRRRANCRSYTNVLIRRGDLVPKPCEVCGDPNVQPHHENYDDPRTVRWLCRKHHRAEHKPEQPLKCSTSSCENLRDNKHSTYCRRCRAAYMVGYRRRQLDELHRLRAIVAATSPTSAAPSPCEPSDA